MAIHQRSKIASNRTGSAGLQRSQSPQIGRYNGQPHVAAKGTLSFPGATVKSQAPLDPGYDRLYTGPEVTQALVNPVTSAHVDLIDASLLGEANVLDAFFFGGLQIGLGGKPAIQGRFERIPAVNLALAVEHVHGQVRIGRIALGDQAIGDQLGSTDAQTNLVAEVCFAAILDDDVSVRFEDRNHFFRARDAFAFENPKIMDTHILSEFIRHLRCHQVIWF